MICLLNRLSKATDDLLAIKFNDLKIKDIKIEDSTTKLF